MGLLVSIVTLRNRRVFQLPTYHERDVEELWLLVNFSFESSPAFGMKIALQAASPGRQLGNQLGSSAAIEPRSRLARRDSPANFPKNMFKSIKTSTFLKIFL